MEHETDGYFADGDSINGEEESSSAGSSSAASNRLAISEGTAVKHRSKKIKLMKYFVKSTDENDDEDDDITDEVAILKLLKRKRRRHKHKRRSRGEKGKGEDEQKELVKPAPSPVHPDIDLTLTNCISYGGTNVCEAARVEAQTYNDHVMALSGLLSNFFAPTVKERQEQTNEPAPQPSASYPPPKKLVKEPSSPRSSSPLSVLSIKNITHKFVNNLPLRQLGSNTRLSNRHFHLDNVLSLSSSPRLLLEAAYPHRVIYANAAFAQDLLGDYGTSLHQWIEQQNSSPHDNNNHGHTQQQQQRTLDYAIQQAFSTRVPVTVYPVLGNKGVTHYLIEGSAKLQSSSDEEDEPGEAPQLAVG